MKTKYILLFVVVCCLNLAHCSDEDARELGYPDADSYKGTAASLRDEARETRERRDANAREQGYSDRNAFLGTQNNFD